MIPHLDKEWLNEIYDTRKKRTVEITQKSIELLLSQEKRISLNSIITISRQIDLKGISHSAILNNQEARKLYETYRNWSNYGKVKEKINLEKHNLYNLNIKTGRNLDSLNRKLIKLTKTQLIERLIIVEEAYAVLHKKWLEQQSKILDEY
ncbi:hypothetical protein DX910_10140 [Acinetobacter haemolyticus]|nr:hypothetical protein DX910_10140 [Acinetobacter haemolyticus]